MSNDYFKAQGWFKNYALNSQDSRGMFQRLVKEDEEAFKLASAETDKIKNMINKKYGSGTMKYGSEISQPSTRPDVIEIDAINAFMKRNPAAEGGRIPFKYAGPVKFENIIKPKIYEGNRFSKKLPKGTFTMRLYMGLDADGNRIEETFTGTKKKLKEIFDKNNKARVKGDLPTMGDSKVYKVRQGKNKGKFAIKMPKEDTYSFYETEDLAEKHKTDYLNDPANKVGGDRTKKVIPPDGYVSGKDMLAEAKKKKIYVGENRQASNFADVFGFPKTTKDGQMFYDISKLNNEEAVDAILKSQVTSGSATEEAKKKFPVKTKSELQKPRLEAIEAGGGVKKNDPYAGKRGSGIELGHTGNIYGTELITGDRLAYTPTEVNQLMGKEGNLDDKIRSVSAKIENIKASDKPANVKKDLLEQADNILIRLASQSQGFKKVTLSGGGTFGGDRLTIDPFNTYPGKTEKEIQKIQKEYLGKKIITKGPNKTSPKEIQKIQDAFFFEKNRKEVMKASKKIGKKEIKKITENINLKEIESYITDTTGKVKQPMFSSGFAGAYEMLSDDLKKITNTEGFKKFSKIAKTPGKFFGIGDVVLGYLDYKNNLGKYGDDERGRALSLEKAKQAMSFGLWKGGDRKYIEQLKETYIKNGGDDSVFDQVISLNKQNSELMSFVEKTKEQYQRELENEKTYGTAGGAAAIKFQLDVPSASNTLKNNLSVIKNKAENMDKDFTTFTETYKGTDLTQPSKDIKAAAFEDLAAQKRKVFNTQSKQLNTEAGPIGNWLLNNIFTTDARGKTKEQAYIDEMAKNYPQELYRYNLERGVDPDNPVTFNATSNLISKPELGFNFSEGGITSLRSKYEYKK